MSIFELNKYRLEPEDFIGEENMQLRRNRRVPRHKKGGLFLKGPIPLDWLIVAGRLSGSAFRVAIALWYQVGRRRNAEVRFSARLPAEFFKISRSTATRGLRELEGANLIEIKQTQGRAPMVVLLDAPNKPGADKGECQNDL